VSELYTSALFKSAVAYAKSNADRWYVLSAKHGLLSPDQVIAPYDTTLKNMSRAEQRAWAGRVQEQLLQVTPVGAEVLVLAGVPYRQHLVPFLEARGHSVSVPLQGMRFGEQLKQLASQAPNSPAAGAHKDLDRLYAIFRKLASLPGQGVKLGECHGRMPWPKRGVYFFVEPGEFRSDGKEHRIVRVGTHAVSTGSRSTLWKRLRAHRGASSGDGNHRGSIFRRHVGVALLAMSADSAAITSWGLGSNAPKPTRAQEAALEGRVSSFLATTRVYWVDVPDEAGRNSLRSYIERNAIALLSNGLNPLDKPSACWLGRKSDRECIRQSGLWNVDYVGDKYDPVFLQTLEECVRRMSSEA
jgi:hypothetical protein